MHHDHVLPHQEATSGALHPAHRCQAGPSPSLGAKPSAGRLLCQAEWFSPTSNAVSGDAACSDAASEIPNAPWREEVRAQPERRIKH